MGKRSQIVLILSLGLAGVCGAQTLALSRNTLTNQGVVTLARAGFDEEFIIDTIVSSKTAFDTSVDGLADLSKQGLSERLIRIMINPTVAFAPVGPLPPQQPRPVLVPMGKDKGQVSYLGPTAASIPIGAQSSGYPPMSWGAMKPVYGSGSDAISVVRADNVRMHMGLLYDSIAAQRTYLPIGGVGPSWPLAPVAVQFSMQQATQPLPLP